MFRTNWKSGRGLATAAIVATLGLLVVAALPWDGRTIRETDCWILPNGRVVNMPGQSTCPLHPDDLLTAADVDGKRLAVQYGGAMHHALHSAGEALEVEALTPQGRKRRTLPVHRVGPNERIERGVLAGALAALLLVLPLSILWRSTAHAALPFAIVYGLVATISIAALCGRESTLHVAAAMLAFSAIPPVVLHLALVFPRDRRMIRAAPRSQWLPYLLLFVLVPAGWFAIVHNPSVWPAFLFTVLALTAGAWLVFVASCAFALRESDSPIERARARVLCYGALLLPLVPTLAIAPRATGIPDLLTTFVTSAAVMLPIPIGLAITRYNLFNVGWDARRSIGRLIYLMGAAGLVTLVFQVGADLTGAGKTSIVRTFLLSLIALSVAEMLLRRVPGIIDSMLLPKLHAFRTEQRAFAKHVATLTDEDEVARLLTEALKRTVEPERGCVFLNLDGIWRPACPFGRNPPSEGATARKMRVLLGRATVVHFAREDSEHAELFHHLLNRGIEASAALRSGGRLLGLVVIGSRPDARPYSDIELQQVEALVTQATKTLESARLAGELVTAERHSTRGRVALALAHDLGKELDWIVRLAERLPERLSDEKRLRRDARQIAELASGVQESLHDFVEESTRSNAEAGATRLEEVLGLAARQVSRIHGAERVTTRLDPSARNVLVHPATIRVTANLLDNAVRASAGDQPVEISARHDGEKIEIAVSDSGCGMTPEVAAQVFTAGFTTRRDEGGLGIGLSAAREIVEALGGSITLESEVGNGTQVIVSLRIERRST